MTQVVLSRLWSSSLWSSCTSKELLQCCLSCVDIRHTPAMSSHWGSCFSEGPLLQVKRLSCHDGNVDPGNPIAKVHKLVRPLVHKILIEEAVMIPARQGWGNSEILLARRCIYSVHW